MAHPKVHVCRPLQGSQLNSRSLRFNSSVTSGNFRKNLLKNKHQTFSEHREVENSEVQVPHQQPSDSSNVVFRELFAENVLAKHWRVATRDLENNDPPAAYPEDVPQSGAGAGKYSLREAEFWTCGFFPGTLFALLERTEIYPQSSTWSSEMKKWLHDLNDQPYSYPTLGKHLLKLCQKWSEPLHKLANRTDTHDLGFIIEPALRANWELTGNIRSLHSVIKAARNLASRYDPRAKAIRSWDFMNKKDVEIISMEENFIIIIDSLCNLDLLFYASAQSGDEKLAEMARLHAHTLLYTHLRKEPIQNSSRVEYKGQMYSTCHVANLDPRTGQLKARMTAQGYAAESTWSRGQAWGILGYSQTYKWTKERIFLDTACGLAEYFLLRLQNQEFRLNGQLKRGCKVPLWDFDAPIEDQNNPVLDSSAGVIAAYGILLLSQDLGEVHEHSLSARYLDAAIDIVKDVLQFSIAEEKAKFVIDNTGGEGVLGLTVEDVEPNLSFDSVLKNATTNNNVGARKRCQNHGLVYADYYLVKFGNQLLKMGLV